MKLSPHFTLAELTKSSTALRYGIDNTPNDAQIENLKILCENILEPVRDYYGRPFSPSSGFRCLELNRSIGSKDTSQHTKGEAVDFEILGIDNSELHQWIEDNIEEYDQNILEYYTDGEPQSGWVHASYSNDNRNQTFSIP